MRTPYIDIKLLLFLLISQIHNSFLKIVTFENFGTGQVLSQNGQRAEPAVNENELSQKWQLKQVLYYGRVVYTIQNFVSKECIHSDCETTVNKNYVITSCGQSFSMWYCNGDTKSFFYIIGNDRLTLRNYNTNDDIYINNNGDLKSCLQPLRRRSRMAIVTIGKVKHISSSLLLAAQRPACTAEPCGIRGSTLLSSLLLSRR